jgi:LuxR family maltose regulon positive regulatory protein
MDEAAGCVDRLERLAGKYTAVRPCAWSEIEWYHKLSHAHLLGQQDRPDDAIAILQVLQRETEAAQHRYFLIRSAIHLSAIQLNAGKVAEATNRFRRVLTAGAAAGLYQTILDEGPIINQILRTTQVNGNLGADLISYADRLMTGVEGARQARLAPRNRHSATDRARIIE